MAEDLDPQTLVPMNAFIGRHPVLIDLVYANPNHPDNHFNGLYNPEAKILWAHKDIAAITLAAANLVTYLYGWSGFKLNDCLRPVEAQEAMENYGYHSSLVSLPGSGAHPRAMAMDIEPLDKDGNIVDMGTAFDFFANDPAADNPAARNYTKFESNGDAIWQSRARLEYAMRTAATELASKINPLPQEWWDFRLEQNVWEQYNPLYEADLLPCQRVIALDKNAAQEILDRKYPDFMREVLEETDRNAVQAYELMRRKHMPEEKITSFRRFGVPTP